MTFGLQPQEKLLTRCVENIPIETSCNYNASTTLQCIIENTPYVDFYCERDYYSLHNKFLCAECTSNRTEEIIVNFFSENIKQFIVRTSTLNCDLYNRSGEVFWTCNTSSVSETLWTKAHYDWSFLFVAVFIIAGGLGNILVCLAVLLDRRLQNVTNYFLLSLAIADLLVSLFVMPLGAIPGFLEELLPKTYSGIKFSTSTRWKRYMSILTIIPITIIILTVCYGVKYFSVEYFSKYMPPLIGFWNLASIGITVVFWQPEITNEIVYLRENFVWDLNEFSVKTQARIRTDCYFMEKLILFTFICHMLLTLFQYIIYNIHLKEIYWIGRNFITNYPQYNWIFHVLLIVLFPCAIGSVLIICHIYYIMHHLNFLMYFLIEEINNMGQFYRHYNILNTISSDVFKLTLKRDLVSLIKQHSKIIRYTLRLKNIQLVFFFVSLSSLTIGYFCVLDMTMPNIPATYSVTYFILYLLMVLPLFQCGQSNINTSEEITKALYDLPWYNWDIDNMKLFRLFLILASKNIEIRYQNFWALNSDFAKQHLKRIYSLFSIFNSMT